MSKFLYIFCFCFFPVVSYQNSLEKTNLASESASPGTQEQWQGRGESPRRWAFPLHLWLPFYQGWSLKWVSAQMSPHQRPSPPLCLIKPCPHFIRPPHRALFPPPTALISVAFAMEEQAAVPAILEHLCTNDARNTEASLEWAGVEKHIESTMRRQSHLSSNMAVLILDLTANWAKSSTENNVD